MNVFKRSTARIAAWNLCGYHGITHARLKRQVEGLALLDAEVVTLVEIKPLSVLDDLKQGLEEKGLSYHSMVLPQNNHLHIGVLYKDGVQAMNPRFIEGSDLDERSLRKAFVVDMVVGRLDYQLITVHLKSGRGAKDRKRRDEQAMIIGNYITSERKKSREDILLLGDFNMIPGQDASNFHHLGGNDLMDFISSWDLQDRYSHILESGRANLLDGFAISRTYSKEYIRGSLRVFAMHWAMDIGREKFREKISDHLPFVADFKINNRHE